MSKFWKLKNSILPTNEGIFEKYILTPIYIYTGNVLCIKTNIDTDI